VEAKESCWNRILLPGVEPWARARIQPPFARPRPGAGEDSLNKLVNLAYCRISPSSIQYIEILSSCHCRLVKLSSIILIFI
jgi:hypothetical protein